jgi:nucleoside-diphosphate-sugar epimerase
MDTPSDVTGPINIGNPHEFTIRQLAELVIEMTGAKSNDPHSIFCSIHPSDFDVGA